MNYTIDPQQPATPYNLTEEYKETKAIKKASNYIGIAIILSFIFSIFAMGILYVIAKIFTSHSNINDAFDGLDPVIYYLINSIVAIIASVLPFYISSSFMNNKISDLIQFKTFDKKFGLACIGIGLITCVYANFTADSLLFNLNSIGLYPHIPDLPYDNNIASIIMYTISLSIIPPLVEEFAYRGIVLGSLRQYGDGFAILVSSVLFGLMHANFGQTPFAFIVGLILGFLTVRLNSILPAMIIHFLNNFSVNITTIIGENFGSYYQTLAQNLFSLTSVLIGILCLIYILNKDKNFFSIQRSTSALNLKQKLKAFSSSAAMIIALVLIAIITLTTSIR